MRKAISFRMSSLFWITTLACVVAYFWNQNSQLKREVQRLTEQVELHQQFQPNFIDIDIPITSSTDGSINLSGTS